VGVQNPIVCEVKMSNPRRDQARMALAAVLLAGVAGCTSSPQYPIAAGERAGDGTIMADQPRYPISRADAAQNAQDRAAQAGYPDYNAPRRAPPADGGYAAPSAPLPPAAGTDDADDDAPRPLPQSSVESSDLPPPPAAAPSPATPDASDGPHTISWGGGQIVFGAEPMDGPVLELAAYRHHRRKPAAETASDDTSAAPTRKGRRHAARSQEDAAPDAAPASAAAADTPYQTVVRPGETLAAVAERTHSSRDALVRLNDLKHPRHVRPGAVLKIPYRYAYEVQKGDTLYTISHRFNQDPDAVAKLNGLKNAPTLQPGQTLSLPTQAEDNGARDHASAGGPTPLAAPEKLADAALRKAERRDRRHRHGVDIAAAAGTTPTSPDAAAATVADAAPPAHETRRERRRREREEAAERTAAARTARPTPGMGSAASEVASDAAALRPSPEPIRPSPAPLRPSPEPTPATSTAALRPSPEPVRPAAAAVATAPEATRAPSFVPPTPAATTAVANAAPRTGAATGASPPYYAGVRPPPAPGSDTRVASLTAPRYTPGSPSGAYEPSLGRARPTVPSTPAGPVSSSEVATAGRGRFVWPLRGQVVSTFGVKGEGQHNDGIDIAVTPGTGVRAAAAGEVVYAGSSIPGFGNLVLVKHPGGWVTAYAHLDRIEVRMRDAVAQGQEIGQSGQTGAVDRPLLHFEVRYAPDPTEKARPVDPALVLPAG
jgi:murein DD-endopeptidase MepM/ murein hydrolase activator NlpD